jgi:hypothetical protein
MTNTVKRIDWESFCTEKQTQTGSKVIAISTYEGWENFGTNDQVYKKPYRIIKTKTGNIYTENYKSDNVKGGLYLESKSKKYNETDIQELECILDYPIEYSGFHNVFIENLK